MLTSFSLLLDRIFGSDEFKNPSPRKVGIAMASGSQITFFVSSRSIKERPEMLNLVLYHWSFAPNKDQDRNTMIVSGYLANKPGSLYKLKYNVESGVAYHDPGSVVITA